MYERAAVVSDTLRQSSSVMLLLLVAVVCGLQTELVSQHEVHDPAVTVHKLTVLSQSCPRRLQQDVFAQTKLLLPLIQHPLRQLVRPPAPLPVRQVMLLQPNP